MKRNISYVGVMVVVFLTLLVGQALTATNKRPPTQNAGAAMERQAVLAKVRSMKERAKDKEPWVELEVWLLERTKRNNEAPGGLGKEHKK